MDEEKPVLGCHAPQSRRSVRIFISHASEDEKLCRSLMNYLESNGIDCWTAFRNIPKGHPDYMEAVLRGLKECNGMLLMYSEHVNTSPHVPRELDRALNWRIPILPVRLDDSAFSLSMEYALSLPQRFDALGKNKKAYFPSIAADLVRMCSPGDIITPPDPFEPLPGEMRSFAGITFCWCPSGDFMMGSNPKSTLKRSDDEGPMHRVIFSRGFWMGKYPVTLGQWNKVMGSCHSLSSAKKKNLPVESVSWNDCNDFLGLLNLTGEGTFRLPSEAEWEYACRAGTVTPFYFGKTISVKQANYNGNYNYGAGKKGVSPGRTTIVGIFPPNAWGLHDMHGNVWEWCQDWYHNSYEGAPEDGSAWVMPVGEYRVHRGGSWLYEPNLCRSAYRDYDIPTSEAVDNGFRLVRLP